MHPISPEEYGTYQWLCREVGGALKLSYERLAWNHEQTGRVNSIVQSGVMQFYYPPPIPINIPLQEVVEDGEAATVKDQTKRAPYVWSFLSPLASVSLANGTSAYDLPADFASVVGDFSSGTKRIPIVDESHLRQLASSTPLSGSPQYAAIRPKSSTGAASHRWEVLFYPTPNGSANLGYRYKRCSPGTHGSESVSVRWTAACRNDSCKLLGSSRGTRERSQGGSLSIVHGPVVGVDQSGSASSETYRRGNVARNRQRLDQRFSWSVHGIRAERKCLD